MEYCKSFCFGILILSACSTSHEKRNLASDSSSPFLSESEQQLLSKEAYNVAIKNDPRLAKETAVVLDEALLSSTTEKLQTVLTTPVISQHAENDIFQKGAIDFKTDKDIRLTSWNISYGEDLPTIKDMIANQGASASNCAEPASSYELDRCALIQSDILVLNEADLGNCRSGSVNVTEEIAKTLHVNSAFGPEFFEAEPGYHGLTSPDKDLCQAKWKIKGDGGERANLTGNAILSRFPMSNVRRIPLPKGFLDKAGNPATPDKHFAYCWDWLKDEAQQPTLIDKGGAFVAAEVFKDDDLRRQLRFGGRNTLVADINLPSGQTITVAAMHLEDMASPNCRYVEMSTLLEALKGNPYPIVYAGDFNTTNRNSGHQSTALTGVKVSIEETVESPRFWAETGLYAMPMGVGEAITVGKALMGYLTTHRNPTRKNIFWFRPNNEGNLFSLLKHAGILWKGNAESSLDGKTESPWSITNERAKIGFKGTEYLNRPIGPIGESKLDWIFYQPNDVNSLQPRYPRTLEHLRELGKNYPSDHIPVSVIIGPSPQQ